MITPRKPSLLPSRILLVDDNPHGNIARKALLEEQGFAVEAVGSGEDALEAFLAGPFDLVVTDLRMKKMDGLQLIRSIRGERPATPIILLSGFAGCMGLTEENTGADAVLAKSSKEEEQLPRAIRQLLARRTQKKPAAAQKRPRSSMARSG
jgi:CheY-like chemotaxis protein